MKKIIFSALVGVLAVGNLMFAPMALAATPNLNISNYSGDSATLYVNNADPNSSIQLNYILAGSSLPTVISNFGYTNSSGNYSSNISASTYGITGGSQVYVTVNGQQSNRVTFGSSSSGCGYYGCSGSGSLSLSQTSVSLSVNQSSNVAIYNNSGNNAFISSNSSPSVVSASLSNNQINLYGQSSGSSTISICVNYGSCVSLYVTVSGSSSGGSLSFSQTSVNLTIGQSATISAYNAIYSSFYISNNSNPSVVDANTSGTNIYLTGRNIGTSNITVCNGPLCGTIYVTVGGSTGQFTISPSSLNLNVGQTGTAVASFPYVYSGSLSVGSNSNSNVATVSFSGSTINVYAQNVGSTTISICYNSACNNLYVTVSGSSTSGNVWFNPSSASLYTGQSLAVSINSASYATGGYSYSSNPYYISSNSNSSVVSASVSGTVLNLYGQSNGSSNITVCMNSLSYCGTLYVTVSGGSSSGSVWFSPTSLNLSSGQSQTVNVYGNSGSGSFYVSSNSSPSVATASLSGNNLYIYGQSSGSTTISVCASNNGCGNLYVTVSGYSSGYLYFVTTSLPSGSVNQYYSQQLSVSGGSAPYTYSITSGSLPSNVNLSSSGQIYGTPSFNQTSNFTIRAQDSFGRSATQNFSLTIGSVLGISLYQNGQLFLENGTIYITYKNTKTGFATLKVFKALGFNLGQVSSNGFSGLSDSGFIVRTSRSAHPWGSWVKSGNTVYFVHESGLIPVPSYDTFQNNGGQDYLVVRANSYDFRLPMLSAMTNSDPRLQ